MSRTRIVRRVAWTIIVLDITATIILPWFLYGADILNSRTVPASFCLIILGVLVSAIFVVLFASIEERSN